MFCPKCGAQNADETKFCRGCGVDISRVLPAVLTAPVISSTPASSQPSKRSRERSKSSAFPLSELETGEGETIAERYVDLLSRGWRGLLIGGGFLIIAALIFGLFEKLAVLGIFLLMFTVVFIGTGISRFVQAKGLKRLLGSRDSDDSRQLTPGQGDYMQPSRSLFTTDDLTGEPRSITEHTTTRLKSAVDRKS